jgi:hypothetical protein
MFLVSVFPYIQTAKRITGHYFYNVNSTFYVWYDTWAEAVAGTRAHGDRTGWPDMPAEDIPSMGKYLREHTVGQMVARVANGAAKVMTRVSNSYGYLDYVVVYAAGLVLACAVRWRRAWDGIRTNPFPPLFAVAYVSMYVLLYFWYAPIAYGDRLILALFLPVLYAVSRGLHHLVSDERLHLGRHSIRWLDLANVAILPWLLAGAFHAVSQGVYVMTGGG